MDAVTLLENVLDVSHVPFTHHKTVGKRTNAAPVEPDHGGRRQRLRLTGRRGHGGASSAPVTTFLAPQLMWHDLTAKGFGRILTVVYAVPIRRGECRLFARFPFQFQSALPRLLIGLRPRWLQHIGNHKVLEDDQVFLHWQERTLAAAGGSAPNDFPTDGCRRLRGCVAPLDQQQRWRAVCRPAAAGASANSNVDGPLPSTHTAATARQR